MAKLPCPKCNAHQGQSLADLLCHDRLDYFLCAKCGHLWTIARDGTGRVAEVAAPGAPGGSNRGGHGRP